MDEEWVEYDGGVVRDWHRSARRIRVAPGVAVIPDGAFDEFEDLTAVDLGNVTTISDVAFRGCNSLERVVWSIASAVEIGGGAFLKCGSLREIELSNVTKIGAEAFYDCEALTTVSIPSSVAAIGESAFRWCTNLTEGKLGEGIHRIEKDAFSNCNELVRINIPASVIHIEDGAFFQCSSLAYVELNEGLQQIGDHAFQDCNSLQSTSIPSSVLKVGDRAFAGCHQLRRAELQEGLQTIGWGALLRCHALKRIRIPSSVTSVGSDAFYGCHNLAEVTLREGLHCIGDRAFGSCTSLDHINIPPVALVIDIKSSPTEGIPFGPEAVEHSTCQLMRSTIPKTIRGKKLVVSKWMQYRGPDQLEQAEAKVNEILGRNDLAEEEKIQCIREWFAYFDQLDVTTMLELAVWRANMDEDEQDAAARQATRGNCGSDMNIIIPGVLPFLVLEW